MKVICKFCGDNTNSSSICQSCGRSVEDPNGLYRNEKTEDQDLNIYYQHQKKHTKKVPKSIVIISLILMFPIGVLLLYFSDFSKRTQIGLTIVGLLIICMVFLKVDFTQGTEDIVSESSTVSVAVAEVTEEKTDDILGVCIDRRALISTHALIKALGVYTINDIEVIEADKLYHLIIQNDQPLLLEVENGEMMRLSFLKNSQDTIILYDLKREGFINHLRDVY